jgi:beta-fructofuranosidase
MDMETNEAQAAVDAASHQAAQDPNRPIFHAMCPANWMNDPNGPILIGDEVHVFYQHHPFKADWGPMYWGHMKSKDLVHWTQLPIAFGPSTDKGEDGCWSGSCLIGPSGLPTALYTSVGPAKPATDKSEQWLAVGSKDMARWEKSPANPVMTQILHGKLRIEDWRDPFAWRAGDAYYCVLGGHLVQVGKPKHNPTAFLYTSPDMVHWTFLGPMYSRYRGMADAEVGPGVNLGTNWECPLFFPLGDKHVLEVSVNGTAYTIGTFKNNKYTAGKWHALDYSDVFYAPHTFVDKKGRRIIIGWVRTSKHLCWNGCFSVPRVVTDRGDGTLGIEPLPEINQLRGDCVRKKSTWVPANAMIPLLEDAAFPAIVSGRAIECLFQIPLIRSNVGELAPPAFELQIYDRVSGQHPIMSSFGYEPEDGLFFIGNKSGAFKVTPGERVLDIHIFVDRAVVEIFINGRWAITNDLPITSESNLFLRLTNGMDSTIELKNVACWKLQSIHA